MTAADVYWKVSETLCVTATEKAGYTSIKAALNGARCIRLSADMVRQRGLRTSIYLRHPITRFASAYAYFAPNDNYPIQPSRAAYALQAHPTIENFTDAVLAGMANEHWCPQLEQHQLDIDEIYRFEDINELWPKHFPDWPLGHYNSGRIDKPVISYRLQELNDFYRHDLDQWENA
jgi:hypothetical protein